MSIPGIHAVSYFLSITVEMHKWELQMQNAPNVNTSLMRPIYRQRFLLSHELVFLAIRLRTTHRHVLHIEQ